VIVPDRYARPDVLDVLVHAAFIVPSDLSVSAAN
jgi:hypothetical protein